jgi:hypothetical protein
MRRLGRSIVAIAAVASLAASGVLFSADRSLASDHQDSPLTVSRPGIDITDVYVYPSPTNPKNVVLAMDVSPLIPAGMGTTRFFDPGAMYQLKIAHGTSFVESQVIQFKAEGVGPTQRITMYGPGAPSMTGTRSTFIASRMGSVTYNTAASLGNGVKLYAGPREDPFYFDLTQFFRILPDRNFKNQPNPPPPGATCFRKPGHDFLASYNVLQLAVEMPRRLLAGPDGQLGRINVWATTSIPSTDPNAMESGPKNRLADVVRNMNSILTGHGTIAQTYVQVERLGRPAVKEATENYAQHDTTNRVTITNDDVLRQSIYRFVTQVAHRAPGVATSIVNVLIPDAIEADLSKSGPARYLAVETSGKSGYPVGLIRAVPVSGIEGIKKALSDPDRRFGGRDLDSPVIDLSLGAIFGSIIPKVGLAHDDGKETPCLTSDNTTPAEKHFLSSFPYAGAPR